MRIPWIETPLARSKVLSNSAGCNVYLKLENLQPSGSFKSRGVGNFMRARLLSHESAEKSNDEALSNNVNENSANKTESIHFYSSSGGNAGLGCVHAAVMLGFPATIVVPFSTTPCMIEKLKSWAEADEYLVGKVLPKATSGGEHAIYVPPFDAQEIWDGNASMIEEVSSQLPLAAEFCPAGGNTQKDGRSNSTSPLPHLDVVICSVGGGGLFCGIMQGLKKTGHNDTQVLAMETKGADSLSQAVEAKEAVTLPGITSIATSLGARKVCQKALEYGMEKSVACVVLSDAEAVHACQRFLDDERILVEPACGASLAPYYNSTLPELVPGLGKDSNVVEGQQCSCCCMRGSNVSWDIMKKYVEEYGL
ncbi:tryptophan synthase beta subunit-like PLP-dependent enzyme [Leptodontidium sp. 2 PMI_412]|nr:tryptophan synthase beta subunit-like PLP-dependent enzyme [Leptodontidium sp. 2 PMI_412]